ncbi:MAG: FAD-dependent monooxygenase [Hyphomicrobiales bacterium]|nr:FAD-dependent monooxygenase [Hyphomicrobiales bacterium]
MQLNSKNSRVSLNAVVAGAGPAGLACGLALLKCGMTVAIAGPSSLQSSTRGDTRTTALIGPSVLLLRELGVWGQCEAHAAPLKSLTLIDQTGRLLRAPDITFHASEAGLEAFGYNVPNQTLVAALMQKLSDYDGGFIDVAVTDVHPVASGVALRLQNGQDIHTALVVGADGRNSLCRAAAGIAARRWNYGHTAIACSFEHTAAHNGACVELHRAGGPMTTVPLPGRWSSLVWVERPDEAARLMSLSEPDFAAAVQKELGSFTGAVVSVKPRAAFPLIGLAVSSYAKNRIALAGEAAHVVPPIGAQGLNLGFRDAAILAECVGEAFAADHDIGGAQTLAAYNAKRRGDVLSRTLAADLLNRTLIAGFLPFDAGRAIGLSALSASPRLRQVMMRRGMGGV